MVNGEHIRAPSVRVALCNELLRMVSSQSQVQSNRAQSDSAEVIFLAFKEWLAIQEARLGQGSSSRGQGSLDDRRDEVAFAPDAAVEHRARIDSNQTRLQGAELSNVKRSAGRRLFRFLAFCLLTAAIVGAALVWQSWNENAKAMMNAFMTSSGWISSNFVTKPPALTSDQAAAMTRELPPELRHQLETLVTDLAAVRRAVEAVAAKQERMAQDIATLQAAEQKVSDKTPPLRPSTAPPRKNAQAIAPLDSGAQAPLVPVPPPRPQMPSR